MKLNNLFTPVFLAVASLLAGPMSSVASAEVIVNEEPPAARHEAVKERAGYVYAHGNWQRKSDKWDWRAGHYEKARAGHHWTDGRWEQRGKGRVWIEGSWD